MLKLFFDFKPDFKIKNRQGYTPLALSAVLGRKEVHLIRITNRAQTQQLIYFIV